MSDNLSGFWSGKYWYDEPGEPVVPFLALLDDGDSLSGEITEPNTAGYSSSELEAFIVGSRDGRTVFFAKVFDGASDLAHRVNYVGKLCDDGTRLADYWLLDDYSGGFEISRTIVLDEEQEISEIEIVEPARVITR